MIRRSSPPVLPSAPADLVAVAVGGSQVILAWAEGGAGALGFRIERSPGNDPRGPFMEIGGVGTHVTAYRDGSVESRSTYSYRIRAWNLHGDSSPSGVAEVTLP
jgi:hypothetical protein